MHCVVDSITVLMFPPRDVVYPTRGIKQLKQIGKRIILQWKL